MKHQTKIVSFFTLVSLIGGIWYLSVDHNVNWKTMAKLFQNFHLLVLIPALFAVLMQVFFRTLRLWVLCSANTSLGWFDCARAYSFGQMLNCVVPAQAGEVVKSLYLKRKDSADGREIPMSETLGLLLADRTVDAMVFVCLAIFAFWSHPDFLFGDLKASRMPSLRVILLVTFVLIVLLALGKRFSKSLRVYRNFFFGLSILKNWRRLSVAGVCALFAWAAEMIALYIICRGQDINLTPSQAAVILVVLNLGLAIPAFANLGTFEAAMTFAMVHLGFPLEKSLSLAAVHHLLQILGVALWAITMWIVYQLRHTHSLEESPAS